MSCSMCQIGPGVLVTLMFCLRPMAVQMKFMEIKVLPDLLVAKHSNELHAFSFLAGAFSGGRRVRHSVLR
jgi:hypothetical protein